MNEWADTTMDYRDEDLVRVRSKVRSKPMLSGIKRAVFFGAHTDDEFIAAGTLNRLVRSGTEVWVYTLGPAAVQGDVYGGRPSFDKVLPEWKQSLERIGCYGWLCDHLLPSICLGDKGQKVADLIYSEVDAKRPDCVFLLSPDDENPAHAVIGIQGERVLRGRCPLVIRCNYPWNYSLGRPNLFVSLDEEALRVKEAVIDCYQSQRFRYDYKRLLMAQAVADGESVKVRAAEKFEITRMVT